MIVTFIKVYNFKINILLHFMVVLEISFRVFIAFLERNIYFL